MDPRAISTRRARARLLAPAFVVVAIGACEHDERAVLSINPPNPYPMCPALAPVEGSSCQATDYVAYKSQCYYSNASATECTLFQCTGSGWVRGDCSGAGGESAGGAGGAGGPSDVAGASGALDAAGGAGGAR